MWQRKGMILGRGTSGTLNTGERMEKKGRWRGGLMQDCQEKKETAFQQSERERPTGKTVESYVEEMMIMNEGTRERKCCVWRGFGWQKAVGDCMHVWMTLQSSHMPDRCHVW